MLFFCCRCFQPLTLSPFFYPYSLKLNMFTITLSAPLSASFHPSPFCLLFMLSGCPLFCSFPLHLCDLQQIRCRQALGLMSLISLFILLPLSFWSFSFCPLVSGHCRRRLQPDIILFLFLFYKESFLRLESQKGSQVALKRQWSGRWKQSIFQNAAVQSWTFMLAE